MTESPGTVEVDEGPGDVPPPEIPPHAGGPSEGETRRGALGVLPAWASSERLALWVFIAFVVAAVPLILFHFGSYHWFFRDEFIFLADRKGTFPPCSRRTAEPTGCSSRVSSTSCSGSCSV